MATVTILLAAYNGAAFLRQQVDSLLAQTDSDFRLILSDDGSTDGTPEMLDLFAAAQPDRVFHYRSGQRFGNAQDHFLHLLRQFHDTPYIMFCDQDDVWHKDKIEKTLAAMRQLETDPAMPALIHTDLRVVDGALRPIAPSFCGLSHLDGNRLALHQLVAQNVVTGCTVMINRALAELACRDLTGETVLMHDWWLALLAAAAGKAGFLSEATIDYRQHGRNTVGAKNARSLSYLWKRFTAGDTRRVMARTAMQAGSLLACYRDCLPPQAAALLTDFAATAHAGKLTRIRTYCKHRTFKHGFVRILAQLLNG